MDSLLYISTLIFLGAGLITANAGVNVIGGPTDVGILTASGKYVDY